MATEATHPYDHGEAKRVNSLPDCELGEGGPFVEFDSSKRVTYGENTVAESGYDGRRVYVGFTEDSSRASLTFATEIADDGTIIVTGYGPGMLTCEEVYVTRTDAPHAKELEPLYDHLFECGVRFEDMDGDEYEYDY